MTQEAAASGTSTRVPRQRSGEHEVAASPQAEEPTRAVRSVPIDRLLSVATLTPAQASLVVVRLLDATARVGDEEGSGEPPAAGPGRTRVAGVALTSSGEVDVAPAHDDEGAPVADLLHRLLLNARRLRTHPRPQELLLLQRLEVACVQPLHDPGARARALDQAVGDALGPGAEGRLQGQLAALVDAFAHVASGLPARGHPRSGSAPVWPELPAEPAAPAAAAAGPGAGRATPARHDPSRAPRRSRTRLHRRPRGRRLAVVLVVLAAVLAAAGWVVLRGNAGGLLGALGNDTGAAPPAAAASPRPSQPSARAHRTRAVPLLAAAHAGPFTGVSLQPAGRCVPGALCPVKVTVHLRPATSARAVTWRVGAAHACTRRIAWSPPTTMTVRAGWTSAYAHSSVRVPTGRPLALVALTTSPARVQSRAVPVAGSSLRC